MRYFYKENKPLDDMIDRFFEAISNYNDTYCNSALSVVLLGSLSRGEGTWVKTDRGCHMLSDIEFLTVHPSSFRGFFAYNERLDRIAFEIFGSDNSSLFHIDNSFVCREKMPTMERKLLTYDALEKGVCVVGEDVIVLLPKINIRNINLCDIRDILTHRVFSILYYGFPLKQEGDLQEYRYNITKNSLDLMTVLLVEHGILASSFMDKLNLLKELDIDENLKHYFEYCLSIKLSTDCQYSYSIEELENNFITLVQQLMTNFRIPLKNKLINIKHVTRRLLGMLKRTLRYKHIPRLRHLPGLVKTFKLGQCITKGEVLNNLVINGYPIIRK